MCSKILVCNTLLIHVSKLNKGFRNQLKKGLLVNVSKFNSVRFFSSLAITRFLAICGHKGDISLGTVSQSCPVWTISFILVSVARLSAIFGHPSFVSSRTVACFSPIWTIGIIIGTTRGLSCSGSCSGCCSSSCSKVFI